MAARTGGRFLALIGALVATFVVATGTVRAAVPDPSNDPTGRISLVDLRPRTSAARYDRPRVYTDGCHVQSTETRALHCVYGDPTGTKVVVVIGDSVIAQWWSAIDGAAKQGGWKVIWMSKTACPAADVTIIRNDARYSACDTWRRNALTNVRNQTRVDLLLVSGSTQGLTMNRSTGTAITDPAQRGAEWEAGYKRTIDRVAGEVRRVVILRDTPVFRYFIPSCLVTSKGWTKPCSRAKDIALDSLRADYWGHEEAVDASYSWVRATDMSNWICQPDRCWPVTSSRILRYRDSHHMTDTFVKTLAPVLRVRLSYLMR
jgi:hypothetical protein